VKPISTFEWNFLCQAFYSHDFSSAYRLDIYIAKGDLWSQARISFQGNPFLPFSSLSFMRFIAILVSIIAFEKKRTPFGCENSSNDNVQGCRFGWIFVATYGK